MEITSIVTTAAGIALAVPAVGLFVAKYVTKANKYMHLAKDAVATLSDVVDALKDGKLTQEEIADITKDVAAFKDDLRLE